MKKAKPGVCVAIASVGSKLVPGYFTDTPGLSCWNDKHTHWKYGKAKLPWQLIHQASGMVIWRGRVLRPDIVRAAELIKDCADWTTEQPFVPGVDAKRALSCARLLAGLTEELYVTPSVEAARQAYEDEEEEVGRAA